MVDVHHIGAGQTGNETWSRNIARELATIDTQGDIVFATTAKGATEVEHLTGRRPEVLPQRSAARLAFGLPQLLSRLDARACLVSYTPPPTRIPTVVAVHDMSAFDPGMAAYLSRTAAHRYRASIRFAARRATSIVVPTAHAAADLTRVTAFPPSQTTVAGIPIDPDLALLLEGKRPRRSDPFVVLVVGTLLPRKNVRVVADAVSHLQSDGLAVELRVAGPVRPAGAKDATYVNGRLGAAVRWTGYLSREQLAAEYLGADVLAFPSVYEGFGIPLIEAMVAGLPIVASNASCIPEVVGGAALLVDPYEPLAWAHALRQIADESHLVEQLVSAGRLRATQFDWATSGRLIFETLQAAAIRTPNER